VLSAFKNSDVAALQRAQPNHIAALDGLRGFAILMVLANHVGCSPNYGSNPLVAFSNALSQIGWMGVDLFFVLSGFLITGILYDSLNQHGYFKKFYMRRIIRIFPLYYGYLAVLFVLSRPLNLVWRGREWMLVFYLQNILAHWTNSRFSVLTGHLWSLAVEEQFYLAWPILVFFIREKRRLIAVAAFACLLSAYYRDHLYSQGAEWVTIYRLTACRMDTLLVGGIVALTLRGSVRPSITRHAKLAFFLLAIFLALVGVWNHSAFHSSAYFRNVPGYSLIAITAACLLIMVLDSGSIANGLFRNELLQCFGRYSYGIYVLHRLCLVEVGAFIYSGGRVSTILHRFHTGRAIDVILSVGLSCALAWLSYNFYEIHFLKLKRYFSYNRPPRQPVIQSSTATIV
jgi:peptidoglycan/LPS O-acetylase OafA/YrhL